MSRLKDLIDKDELEEWSERMSGKPIIDWYAEWQGRRTEGVRRGKISHSTMFTLNEREKAMHDYDLDLEDFDGSFVPITEVALTPKEEAVRIANMGGNDLKRVLRYRIKPSTINRIRSTMTETQPA